MLLAAADLRKVPCLGYLSPGDMAVYDNSFLQGLQDEGCILPGEVKRYDDAFWQSLVKRGYFEGQRIRIEVRATGMDFERAPELAADLVRSNTDVIFAIPAILRRPLNELYVMQRRARLSCLGRNLTPLVRGSSTVWPSRVEI
jgi:hypothetical protein